MVTAGRSHDNAVAEPFFATFKKEEVCRREDTSEQQCIRFCNEVCLHPTLKYQMPQAFEGKYYASFMENGCSASGMEHR